MPSHPITVNIQPIAPDTMLIQLNPHPNTVFQPSWDPSHTSKKPTPHSDSTGLTQKPALPLDKEYQSHITATLAKEGQSDTTYIFDLSNIVYIDSFGLWTLFEVCNTLKQRNSYLILLSPSQSVFDALAASKLSDTIPVLTTVEDAVQLANTFMNHRRKDVS